MSMITNDPDVIAKMSRPDLQHNFAAASWAYQEQRGKLAGADKQITNLRTQLTGVQAERDLWRGRYQARDAEQVEEGLAAIVVAATVAPDLGLAPLHDAVYVAPLPPGVEKVLQRARHVRAAYGSSTRRAIRSRDRRCRELIAALNEWEVDAYDVDATVVAAM